MTILRDLTADQAKEAARDALAALDPVTPGQPDRVRAIKWDHLVEFDAVRGAPVLSDATKALRGDGS